MEGITDATGKLSFSIGSAPPPDVTFALKAIIPAAGVSVKVNGVAAGDTDAEGKLIISVPSDATMLEIEAKLSDLEGILKVSLE